jgi:hypothetical protein
VSEWNNTVKTALKEMRLPGGGGGGTGRESTRKDGDSRTPFNPMINPVSHAQKLIVAHLVSCN